MHQKPIPCNGAPGSFLEQCIQITERPVLESASGRSTLSLALREPVTSICSLPVRDVLGTGLATVVLRARIIVCTVVTGVQVGVTPFAGGSEARALPGRKFDYVIALGATHSQSVD